MFSSTGRALWPKPPLRRHPAARLVCSECREAKLRCDYEACTGPVRSCSRCARLGLDCIASERSRTHKRPAGARNASIKRNADDTETACSPTPPPPSKAPKLPNANAPTLPTPALTAADSGGARGDNTSCEYAELVRGVLLSDINWGIARLLYAKFAFSAARLRGDWGARRALRTPRPRAHAARAHAADPRLTSPALTLRAPAPLGAASTGEAFAVADELQLDHEDAMRMMELGYVHADVGLPTAPQMPAHVSEWHHSATPCFTRVDIGGVHKYIPNAALLARWARLGVPPTSLATGPNVGVYSEALQFWSGLFASREDQRAVVGLWARAVSGAHGLFDKEAAPGHVWAVERRSNVPTFLSAGGQRDGPYAVSVRCALRDAGRELWACFALHAAPPPAAAAPLPTSVGDALWELSAVLPPAANAAACTPAGTRADAAGAWRTPPLACSPQLPLAPPAPCLLLPPPALPQSEAAAAGTGAGRVSALTMPVSAMVVPPFRLPTCSAPLPALDAGEQLLRELAAASEDTDGAALWQRLVAPPSLSASQLPSPLLGTAVAVPPTLCVDSRRSSCGPGVANSADPRPVPRLEPGLAISGGHQADLARLGLEHALAHAAPPPVGVKEAVSTELLMALARQVTPPMFPPRS